MVQVVANVAGFQRGMFVATEAVDKLTGRVDTSGDTLRNFGQTMTRVALVAAAGLGIMTKVAGDFEAAMRNANTVLKVTDEELEVVSSQVLQMARDLPKSSKDLAEGLFFIAGSGFRGAQAMTVLERSSRAAVAGMTETQTAAKGIVGALNAFGLSALEVSRVSDVLFQTVASGIVTFEEVAHEFGVIAASAAAVGISLEEAGIAFAAVTRAGLSASEASTAVARLFDQLINPGKAMTVVLQELGASSGRAAVEQFGLAGVLQKVVEVAGASENAMFELAGNIRSFRALSNLTKDDLALFNAVFEEFADVAGATDRAFQEQAKAFAFAFSRMKTSVGSLTIELRRGLLPVFTSLVNGAQAVVGALGSLASQFPNVTKLIVGALAAFVTLTGAVKAFFFVAVKVIPFMARFFVFQTVRGIIVGLGAALLRLPAFMKAVSFAANGAVKAVVFLAQRFFTLKTMADLASFSMSTAGAVITGVGGVAVRSALKLFTLAGALKAIRLAALGAALAVKVFARATLILLALEVVFIVVEKLAGLLINVLGRAFRLVGRVVGEVVGFVVDKLRGIGEALRALISGDFRGFARAVGVMLGVTKELGGSAGNLSDRLREVGEASGASVRSVEQATAAYERARAAADAFALSQKATAVSQEISAVQVAVDEESIEAAGDRREAAERRVAKDLLRMKISLAEAEIKELAALGRGADDKRLEAETRLQEARADLADLSFAEAEKASRAQVEVERRLADERVQVEDRALGRQLDLRRDAIQSAADIGAQRVELAVEQANREVAQVKRVEDARVSALNRAFELQRDLGERLLSARETLADAELRLQAAKDADLQAQREEAVERGLLSQREAIEANFRAEAAMEKRRADLVVQRETSRLATIEKNLKAQQALALLELESTLRVIKAELNARRGALDADLALRLAGLKSSLAIQRAETVAQVAQLRIQFQARRDALVRELRARRISGQITEREEAARLAEIAELDKDFVRTTADLSSALAQSQAAAGEAIRVSTQATADAKVEAERVAAAEVVSANANATAKVIDLDSQRANAQADAAEKIRSAQAGLVDFMVEQRKRLKDAGFTDAEVEAFLGPVKQQVDSVGRAADDLVHRTSSALDRLRGVWENFVNFLEPLVQRLVDAMTKLSDPTRLLPPGINLPSPGTQAPAPAVPAGVTRSEITVPLVVDGRVLSEVVLSVVNGKLQAWAQSIPQGAS